MNFKIVGLVVTTLALMGSLAACSSPTTQQSAPGDAMKGETMKKEGDAMKKEGDAMKKEGDAMKKEGDAMKKEGNAMKKEGDAMKGDAMKKETPTKP